MHHRWRGTWRRCWACSAADNPHISDRARTRYEWAVESVEAQTGPFTMTDVWLDTRGGPATYSYTRQAVYDMEAHGLVGCVDWRCGRPVPACTRYQLLAPPVYAGR